MKRKIICIISIITLLLISVFCGCGKDKNEVEGVPTPFTDKIVDGVTQLNYIHFNGDISSYDDEATIELVKEVLRAGEYTEIEEPPAGSYRFKLISNDEGYEFEWSGGDIISFCGKLYKVKNHRFKELLAYTK